MSECYIGNIDGDPFSITLASGGTINLRNPRPESISFDDISSSLSKICRFNGHLNVFYSVAEHSVAVAHDALSRGCSIDACIACLMHDAAEAYLGDLSRPLRSLLGASFHCLERRVEMVIGEALGIDFEEHFAEIEISDNAICLAEFQRFRPDVYPLVEESFDSVLDGYRSQWNGPRNLPPEKASNLFWHSFHFFKRKKND